MPKPETEKDIQVARELRNYLIDKPNSFGLLYIDRETKTPSSKDYEIENELTLMQSNFTYLDLIRGARRSDTIRFYLNLILDNLVEIEDRLLKYEKKELKFW